MLIDYDVDVMDLRERIGRLFELSGAKILGLQRSWDPGRGTPVFTEKGSYTSRGWTEWTQGFQFGSAILQFDATGDEQFLEIGRQGTLKRHGHPCQPHRRPRPRIQQRQHLRQPAAADA